MKTHYQRPFLKGIVCKSKTATGKTNQYQNVSCSNCIARMNPGEQAWHDKNNQEWIDYKFRDGRRKK